MTSVLTEAYSRPLSFMARYLPEKSPFMATTPTSTAVISMMPTTQMNTQELFDMSAEEVSFLTFIQVLKKQKSNTTCKAKFH